MNKLKLIAIFFSISSFGQFFEQSTDQEDSPSNEVFEQDEPNYNSEPDQGSEGIIPGNPSDVPIDGWAFLLPVAGLFVGAYYLSRNKKLERN